MSREVKRVSLTFDWPLKQTWQGYLNPYSKLCQPCPHCDRTGYSPEAKRFSDEWYGNASFDPVGYGSKEHSYDHPSIVAFATRNVDASPEFYKKGRLSRTGAIGDEVRRLTNMWNLQWCHHLIQADVDALIEGDRLINFTHSFVKEEGWQPIKPTPIVTAQHVNDWSLLGMGHDAINQMLCVRARCKREGYEVTCKHCKGEGYVWSSQAAKTLYDEWKKVEPPEGPGWQMWESTSDGSPISPVFATPEELARWLAGTGASAFGSQTATYEQWLGMIGKGWAPSAVSSSDGLKSGVEYIGDQE